MDNKVITDSVKQAAFRKATTYLSMSTELSNKHAIELLTSETLRDYIPAQRSLAMLYLQLNDHDAALETFGHLADLGDHVGQLRMACSHIESNENLEKARALLELAATANNHTAKYYLGVMLKDGIGGPADPERGGALLNEAEGQVFENE